MDTALKDLIKSKEERKIYLYIEENKITFLNVVEILIFTNTIFSTYILTKLFADNYIRAKLGWNEVGLMEIKEYEKYNRPNRYFKYIYPRLTDAILTGILKFKKDILHIEGLSYDSFESVFVKYDERIKRRAENKKKRNAKRSLVYKEINKHDDSPLYDKFEYGMSDW